MDHQVDVLFSAITQQSCKLTELNILSIDLSTVSPTLISTSLTKLCSINLWGTMLTSDQLESVFNALTKDSKVTHLNLSNNDLSDIAPSVLSNCISRLTRSELCHTHLTAMQVTMLLTNLATRNCKLVSLDLSGNITAVQQLPQQLLETAARKLKRLELGLHGGWN